ncbi:MAG TPA: DUF1697 domain-containing protein [Longimicrobiales bacterium]|nr:DUF1697 domain-containing protein [Longimicrobiales bacterium]
MPADARLVAFLRAINVGGHTVKMDRLRGLFQEMGFGDVATFIASGNVIFDAGGAGTADVESIIERHLFEALGYAVTTFARTLDDLAAAAAHTPFERDPEPPGRIYVGFLKHAPDDDARDVLTGLDSDTDTFVVHGRELYWLCRTRFSESRVTGGLLEKTLGMPLTIRNTNTLGRIVAKYGG